MCVYIYIYNILHITEFDLSRARLSFCNYSFQSLHIYSELLMLLVSAFHMPFFLKKKKGGGGIFYSHKYIRMIFRLNFQLFSLYPRAVISLLKKEGEKTKGYNRI